MINIDSDDNVSRDKRIKFDVNLNVGFHTTELPNCSIKGNTFMARTCHNIKIITNVYFKNHEDTCLLILVSHRHNINCLGLRN